MPVMLYNSSISVVLKVWTTLDGWPGGKPFLVFTLLREFLALTGFAEHNNSLLL
jgi:hypothetical protein